MFTYLQNMPRPGVSNGNNPRFAVVAFVASLPADFARVASSLARFLTPDKPLRDTFLQRQADEMHIRIQWPNVYRLIPEDHKSKAVTPFSFKCKNALSTSA